jgi:hypothetical protein
MKTAFSGGDSELRSASEIENQRESLCAFELYAKACFSQRTALDTQRPSPPLAALADDQDGFCRTDEILNLL